jgi:hypothetical protein
MYICGKGHLHIKGSVTNQPPTAVGKVTLLGKAFAADGRLLGTATYVTPAQLRPGERAEVNLEFLTVTGPLIQQVKAHQITVTDAAPAR